MSYLDRLRIRAPLPSPIPRTLGGALASIAWAGLGLIVMARPGATENQVYGYFLGNALVRGLGIATPSLSLPPKPTEAATPAPSVDRAAVPAPEPPQRDATHRPDGRRRWPTRPR